PSAVIFRQFGATHRTGIIYLNTLVNNEIILDPFLEKNYRPVSILPTLSKIYERILSDQLTEHFSSIFHDFLSAFRTSFGCQTTLLRIIEDWKDALDRNMYVGAVLMDLSKAFDCIPHDLILAKLEAYGVSKHSCDLLKSYLTNRQQRVKLGDQCSSWLDIIKGVPQGSILGPLIFNIFINDIFYFVQKSTIYNYADDNTLSYCCKDVNILKNTLEHDSHILIDWFQVNQMQANPDKFQTISVGKKTFDKIKSFEIANNSIQCEESVKLLGVEIDYLLNFNEQVTKICQKVARQLNVLQRLSKFLNMNNRLLVFKSFIRSNFNYCPIIWHFCNKTNTEKLEKLQHRGLKIVYNDYDSSYSDLLKRADLPTLHLQRLRIIATETFKCINELSPVYIRDLVKLKESSYSFRYVNTAQVPTVRTVTYGQRSFRFESARVWNSLPNELRQTSNFKEFQRLIRTWTGPSCGCAICRS
ncbi:MAG: reverse transcriptase family protein, partial [Candidatus Thiodiazotropha endolucinida]|nr:reverse transcriptase family protein [Candidatus Thiodiazotropha taylori]MCW4343431.1 reverse transcriptase family protein [Candidatus Thiodiazotropha endolucinida]